MNFNVFFNGCSSFLYLFCLPFLLAKRTRMGFSEALMQLDAAAEQPKEKDGSDIELDPAETTRHFLFERSRSMIKSSW